MCDVIEHLRFMADKAQERSHKLTPVGKLEAYHELVDEANLLCR